jgi:hypothetical protein
MKASKTVFYRNGEMVSVIKVRPPTVNGASFGRIQGLMIIRDEENEADTRNS